MHPHKSSALGYASAASAAHSRVCGACAAEAAASEALRFRAERERLHPRSSVLWAAPRNFLTLCVTATVTLERRGPASPPGPTLAFALPPSGMPSSFRSDLALAAPYRGSALGRRGRALRAGGGQRWESKCAV